MNGPIVHVVRKPLSLNPTVFRLAGSLLLWAALQSMVQAATSITPTTGTGDLGTHVLPPSGNVYGITDGTSIGNNLYHSFGQFNVGTGDIAQFQTPTLIPNAAMHNILGRITDANPSVIFGTIDSATYYPSANLFLMSPNGFLFAPKAMVNVGGMAAFTTADYLRMADNIHFEATPGTQDALLSALPVAAFGFLGANPAAISVQGSTLSVQTDQSLTLVGGNHGFNYTNPDTGLSASVPNGVTITGGRLSARSGQVNIASVASAGEISAGDFVATSGMTMGNITLSQGATLDVSDNAAGAVRIRGGKFLMDNATISADTVNAHGAAVAVDIQVTEDLSISTNLNPAITARTSGSGNAGEVHIASAKLIATSDAQKSTLALIDTHASGKGKAGNVLITTVDLQTTGRLLPFWFSNSGTQGPGNGGDITITARNIAMVNTEMSTGDSLARNLPIRPNVTGSAGNVQITADSLAMTAATVDTDAFGGHGGDLTLNVGDILIKDGSVMGVTGLEGSGALTIKADRFVMDNGALIEADTVFVPGRPVTITANIVEIEEGSAIRSHTLGNADAGDIVITASDHITVSDGPFSGRPSGFYSSTVGSEDVELESLVGNAGSVSITTPRLEMNGGARIDTSTQTNGRGGDVTITASSISITGERTFPTPEDDFDISGSHSSGIFSRAVGSEFCSGPCGGGGHISITTSSLTLGSGAAIDATTTSTGQGGDITIHASDMISLSGTLSDGSAAGIFSRTTDSTPNPGAGGNITLSAGQSVTISDGATISASSTGLANTGNIQIKAGNQFTMTNSMVTTEAEHASGGTIKITTNPSGTVQLTNSTISASVLNGAGGGGSVNIDPLYVLMQNSHILAQAVQGPGGNITINITNGGLFLPDGNSTISASSQFGVNGTVTIQNPNAPAGGQIQPLGQSPLLATSLLNQHCAALAGGEFSSFTVAGRDSLPTEPGSWLASPLALGLAGTGSGTLPEKGVRASIDDDPARETTVLSLRQIAPAGFLTQAFAVDGLTSCQS